MENEKIDVNKIASRARELALDNAKTHGDLAVNALPVWIAATLEFLAIREALSENFPISKILEELVRKPPMTESGGKEQTNSRDP